MNNKQRRTLREIIGLRLREERERLKLTQTQFAELGNASKRTLTDWEQGKLYPNGEFLALLAERGMDVNFIFTGERNIDKLANGESTMLAEIRQLDATGRDGLIQYLINDNLRRHMRGSSSELREQQRETQLVDLFRQMSTQYKEAMEVVSEILLRVSKGTDPGTPPDHT